MPKLDEQSFLRLYAGNFTAPMLLVWGMRKGILNDTGVPMSLDEIAEHTGYPRSAVDAMIARIDGNYIEERDNETTDISRDTQR